MVKGVFLPFAPVGDGKKVSPFRKHTILWQRRQLKCPQSQTGFKVLDLDECHFLLGLKSLGLWMWSSTTKADVLRCHP